MPQPLVSALGAWGDAGIPGSSVSWGFMSCQWDTNHENVLMLPESRTSGIMDSQPLVRHLGSKFTAGLSEARKVPGCVHVCVCARTPV